MQRRLRFANFDAGRFLARYWQRRPLLIKGALPGFEDPVSPEELAGLACEDGVESRLVFTRGSRYRMRTSPFTERDFTTLPAQRWTLLVQAVDHVIPEVKALLQCVDFLPSWRVDDVMISYATRGGGVGPHFDYYDVFLVQGHGTWQLGQRCDSSDLLATSSGLKLLREFHRSAQYALEPGDVLYVPPGLAHWGTAEDDSLCYSLGFRAPSVADMLLGFTDHLAEMLPPDRRYTDPRTTTSPHAGEIDAIALRQARRLLRDALADDDALLEWFGQLQTRLRHPELVQPPGRARALRADTWLMTNPASRIAWHDAGDQLTCFVAGEHESLKATAALRRLLPLLAGAAQPFAAAPHLRSAAARDLLQRLLRQGHLIEVKP